MDYAASAVFGFSHDLFYDDAAAVALRTNYNNIESDSLGQISNAHLVMSDRSDLKIRDWQTYFDFNHYAMQEIKNGTLDSCFEDYKK